MPETPSSKTRVIGRYSILREMRRERHSVSYAAVDPVMNRQLVVKAVELLPAGPKLSAEERKRVEQAFVRQAQAAGRLQHPHIVTVFDAGLSHAFGFLVIERVNGRPLHELLAGGLRPAFVQCASIAARIADALECAHNNGVAHGHLGPQHVYLQADGSPKISGFGGWIDDGASGDEALAGTARLLPYFQNEITEETRQRDVRAIGQLLFMMLTGRAPPPAAQAGNGAAAEEPGSATLRARADTPAALAQIIDQALLPGLGDGPKRAGAMRDALTAFIWNERTENIAPNSLGIPLAAPPPRAPVHVATITPAQGAAVVQSNETAAAAAPAEEPAPPTPAAAPTPVDGVQAKPSASPFEPAKIAIGALLQELRPLLERLRPWATRHRLPLVTGGALLSVAIFIGVMLGNLRHADLVETIAAPASATAEAPAVAPSAPPPASAANVTVGLDIQPWGEVIIDGKALGVAPPMTQVELGTGHHHVEVRTYNEPSWQTDLDVLPTGHAMIVHRFNQ